MENTMTVSQPQETQVTNPVTPVVPDINLDPAAFQAEIAKIAAEQGQKIENGNVVQIVPSETKPNVQQPSVIQPDKPPAVTQTEPVQIPPKFQTPDGSVDLEKVNKSTIHAEEAIKRYQALESELRQKQNAVHQLQTQAAPPQAQPVQAVQGGITPQAINEALERTKNPGQVLLELSQMTYNAAYERAKTEAMAEVQSIRDRVELAQRQTELQKIADIDPWVFSEEGIKTLGAVRQAKPWLNNAPEPWAESYKVYKAEQMLQKPNSQVQTPNPTALTARAPATPVNAANRAMTPGPSMSTLSRDPQALNQFLDRMTPEQQRAFWQTALPGAK